MGDYRRMGNLERQLGDLWRSPRGTVLRIEALALMAIALSFFLATFGSCRRWSNRWILQKGFLAANALFLSLGTYSIGLMQSSSMKSEMYPIWAVSLLALLCCVDSVTASSLDNKSQLWKMLYQLCLYCGYVLLMSISTISSDIGNIAVCVLSAITLLKGFHRSMALLLPGRMRNMIREMLRDWTRGHYFGDPEDDKPRWLQNFIVHVPLGTDVYRDFKVNMGDIDSSCKNGELRSDVQDVCLSFSLSHLLQLRLVGFNDNGAMMPGKSVSSNWLVLKTVHDGFMDHEWAFKVVEAELAFLYDIFFTSNAFLQYYEAKTASIWAFASILGVLVVVVVAVSISETSRTSTRHTSATTTIVDTTTADLIVTVVILLSLALLQVLQLLRCWTSNWARVAFACDYVMNSRTRGRWMGLRERLLKINWFETDLWQNRLGQHSLVESIGTGHCTCSLRLLTRPEDSCGLLSRKCSLISGMLGSRYVGQVLQEMLWGSGTGDTIKLHAHVKASIAEFVSGITSHDVSGWAFPLVGNGQSMLSDYTRCIMKWHIATCYCELARQRNSNGGGFQEKHYDVATALSRYCVYLVVSAPGLLPGPSLDMREVYDNVEWRAREVLQRREDKLWAMDDEFPPNDCLEIRDHLLFDDGVRLGQKLQMDLPFDHWKELAQFWVKALVYAAPSDNVEEHMQHLAQGGEFITHVWALLYHAGIRNWQQLNPPQNKGGEPGSSSSSPEQDIMAEDSD